MGRLAGEVGLEQAFGYGQLVVAEGGGGLNQLGIGDRGADLLGAGLLASGMLGESIRLLQAGLAAR